MQEIARERIAANARAALARRGKTQREAAAALAMPQNSINLRMRGLRSFRAEEIVELARWLGIPVEDLLHWDFVSDVRAERAA